MYHIAVISRNGSYLDSAVRHLSKFNSGFKVRAVSDPNIINSILEREPIDIYVCDHDPPDLDAQSVYDKRLASNDYRPFIVATKHSTNESVLNAFESGISLWVPMDESDAISFMKISKKIVVFVEKYRAEQNNKLNDRRLKSLIQLSNMNNEDFESYMSYALEESINLTSSSIGYLALYNEETQELDMKTWSKKSMDQCMVEGRPMKYYLPKAGLWGEPIRRRSPLVINDYNSDAVPKKGLPEGHIPLKNLIMIPLMHGQEVLGTAGVGNKIGEYTETDLNQFILMMEGFTHIFVEKRQEEATRAVQQRLRNVLMNSPNGILILDGDLNVIDCSEHTKEFLDFDEDYTGRPLPNNNWMTNDLISLVEKLKYTGNPRFTDTVIGDKNPDGTRYRIRIYSDESSSNPFFLISLEDYTAIANMSDTIESGLLMRKVFNDFTVSTINIDIHNIKDRIKYVTDGSLREMLYHNMSSIEAKSRSIKEYGDIGIIAPEWIKVNDAISTAITNYRKIYEFTTKTDGLLILADYTFFRVFLHLIENGISRGGFSKATISYKVTRGNLVIIYEDDATGIPYDKKSLLFTDDIRHENLDFFIINAIITASRFSIKENGDPDRGSRFEITVPIDRFEII